MTGLTSITFRNLSTDAILDLASRAGLEGIEWGADVHVLPGDLQTAEQVARRTAEAGLAVLSYGSYLKIGQCEKPIQEFERILDSAKALGAPMIRVWAGAVSPKDAKEEDYQYTVSVLKDCVRLAHEQGIAVSTEYHRRTLTETVESAERLMQMAPGAHTYWQPNPDISQEENLRELTRIRPYLTNVHVFQWEGSPVSERYPLDHGKEIWKQYIQIAKSAPGEHHFILEFVKDDSCEQLLADAAALQHLLQCAEN